MTPRFFAIRRLFSSFARRKALREPSDRAVAEACAEIVDEPVTRPETADIEDTVAPEPERVTEPRPIVGFYDGIKGDDMYGWAKHVDDPDRPVVVEICFDGVVIGNAEAKIGRPDLRAAGLGHGRFGWRLPLPGGLQPGAVIDVVVRSAGGAPLSGGVFVLTIDEPLGPEEASRCDAFVQAVLGDATTPGGVTADDGHFVRSEPPPASNFLLYAPVALALESFGASEYSYAFVRRAFEPLLRKLGEVHDASDPDAVDRTLAAIEARGETAVLLSFAPPQRGLPASRCPIVSVIAWEYPTIPTERLDGDVSHDWRYGLRRAGRAITLSEFAAAAIRATMGATFPAVSIPAPVYDRFAHLAYAGEMPSRVSIGIRGFVFDTTGREFSPRAPIPPLPDDGPDPGLPSTVTLSGIVFTSVFSPRDSRKNWGDIVIAFLAAHRDHPEATLVLKMIAAEAKAWWWGFHDILNSMPAFSCRILVLHGFLEDDDFDRLVSATHWIVNASNAEGLCLPLLEFMSAGKPAIAPRHTAMSEYINDRNALVVASNEEYFGYPHEEDMQYITTRHRVAWDSLVEALKNGYRVATLMPAEYAAMGEAAHLTMRAFCGDDVVGAKLDQFLGLNRLPPARAISPSDLICELALP